MLRLIGIPAITRRCPESSDTAEDPTCLPAVTAIFRLESENWHRSDMTLLQRCYSDEEICSSLESAGFADIRRYDSPDLGWTREVGRVFYIAGRIAGRS